MKHYLLVTHRSISVDSDFHTTLPFDRIFVLYAMEKYRVYQNSSEVPQIQVETLIYENKTYKFTNSKHNNNATKVA
jgi:hypothetical protein